MVKEKNNKTASEVQLEVFYNVPLGVEEAAAFLKVKPNTIYQLVFYGKIISYKPGGKLLFKRSDLEAYAYSNKRGNRQEEAEKILRRMSAKRSASSRKNNT